MLQVAPGQGDERQANKGAVNQEHGERSDVVDPFAQRQAAEPDPAQTEYERATDQRHAPFAVRHPGSAFADGVGDIGCDKHPAKRNDRDGQQPEIPRNDETGELVQAEFGPLVKTALERHEPIQVNDDGCLRNVKKQNGEQPKEEM